MYKHHLSGSILKFPADFKEPQRYHYEPCQHQDPAEHAHGHERVVHGRVKRGAKGNYGGTLGHVYFHCPVGFDCDCDGLSFLLFYPILIFYCTSCKTASYAVFYCPNIEPEPHHHLKISFSTASRLVKDLSSHGILRETTGQSKNRMFDLFSIWICLNNQKNYKYFTTISSPCFDGWTPGLAA